MLTARHHQNDPISRGRGNRCLEAAGFALRAEAPGWEGMLYYRAWRRESEHAMGLA